MKLLTDSLPQNDFQQICQLLATTIPIPIIKLIGLNEMVGRKGGDGLTDTGSADPQVITAILPDHLPDYIPQTQLLQEIWHVGKLQVIEDINSSNAGDVTPLNVNKEVFQSFIWQPLELTIPAGLWVADHYDGLTLKSLDSHDLPALKTINCPAILCLMDTRPRLFSPAALESVAVLSRLLEKVVLQWTCLQHEQEKLRKLRHDLRTPLTSMTMLPDLIKSSPGIDEECRFMCEQMKIAARKLDLILIESGQNSVSAIVKQ